MAGFHVEENMLGESGLKADGKSACPMSSAQPPKCPECASQRIWKDGLRYVQTVTGEEITVQRYNCRKCGRRFSETTQPQTKVNIPRQILRSRRKSLRYFPSYNTDCQVCAEAKNLTRVESRIEKQAAGATKNIKGEIIDCLWYLKKQGCYRESTIKQTSYVLRRLVRLGVDLSNPEGVREILALRNEWSEPYKQVVAAGYARFAKFIGVEWQKPKYRLAEKLPFIPTEKEIDQLIAGCGPIMATFLRLLKETGLRSGEAARLKWTDIDFERKVVRVVPLKHGRARELKISDKLIAMIQRQPKKSEEVFKAKVKTLRCNFAKARKRIALKLDNPRFEQVHFHTLRHWRATVEYHQTGGKLLSVMHLLGHKNIQNTLIYTHLVNFEADQFITRGTRSDKGARALIEAGFEYVCTSPNDVMLFRKPK